VTLEDFASLMREAQAAAQAFDSARLDRAIGKLSSCVQTLEASPQVSREMLLTIKDELSGFVALCGSLHHTLFTTLKTAAAPNRGTTYAHIAPQALLATRAQSTQALIRRYG
jgi:hypothetical protein